MNLPYRPNVGAVLFNAAGLILIARRADMLNAEGAPGGWQLPQGGVDAGEDLRVAVLRELEEEIGTAKAETKRGQSRGGRSIALGQVTRSWHVASWGSLQFGSSGGSG